MIGAEAELSPRERQFNVGADLLASLRAAIRADGDPLGDEFCRLRPVAQRRRRGATYTPPAIVAAMA
ncbi:MAG: class I SAM-dependent methyltransferase, partial [Alphaproteobacteria bacterium]|nr:class I SAM-dependent methyltransferase [Alphaproteobacteria bacterium]